MRFSLVKTGKRALYAGAAAWMLSSSLGCATTRSSAGTSTQPRPTFAEVLAVLQAHTDVVVLRDTAGQAQIAVVPQYQGRIMTATTGGDRGPSLGWVNLDFIRSGEKKPQFNPFGGAERIWFGPEGSQFSLYFDPGKPAEFAHWRVPPAIDTEPWILKESGISHARFEQDLSLVNQAGTRFDVHVARTVRVLDRDAVRAALAVDVPAEIALCAYESENVVGNAGRAAWTRETGLLSIWILGMFPPGARTRIVVPFVAGDEATLGPIVNAEYFGRVPPERLAVVGAAVVFKGDGKARGKIGVARPRARNVLGSWDPDLGTLTLVQFSLPEDATDYVNSNWGPQDAPFAGDVANAYNDGPTPTGAPLGPFYELESSSPGAALRPGDRLTHVHRTIHLHGPGSALDAIAQKVLGLSLAQIEAALP